MLPNKPWHPTVQSSVVKQKLTSYSPKQCCQTNLNILYSKSVLPNKPWYPIVKSSVAKQTLTSYSSKQSCQTNLDILQFKAVLPNKPWHPTVQSSVAITMACPLILSLPLRRWRSTFGVAVGVTLLTCMRKLRSYG